MSLDFGLYREYTYDDTGEKGQEELFWANITHNLTDMADKAGIYESLWHPERINATKAWQIIPILEKGLKELKKKPNYFEQFNSPNGWGTYEHFVPFVEEVLKACKEYPNSSIYTSV